jgi:patatin-related protein
VAVMGQAPEAPPAAAPVPEAPRHPNTIELRLALVCYGGVSLAIYMHGVTKEIQKLVAASKAYAKDQATCPFPPGETERAYWHALQRREQNEEGARLRVVVDVIAGTSAGGINGIILAKALAHDLPQDSLRDVWLDRGDINKLMKWRYLPSLPLKVVAWLVESGVRLRLQPPLAGDRMFGWIREALEDMDKGDRGKTLMPDQHALELYVTLTDFSGYYRGVPMHDPKTVKDRRHRHVLVFSYTTGTDRLSADWNPALAFAARATSSFPGAFPPINIANIDKNAPGWGGLPRFEEDCWSIYTLSQEELSGRHFVDGGVLDNFPFRHAIDAIRQRPASLEVDRKLVYIEPHPAPRKKAPEGKPPRLGATVAAGLSALPRHEPILDDLLALRDFNERVDRARDVIRAAHDQILDMVPPALDIEDYDERSETALEKAKVGIGYATYTELKLHSVVESFATLASDVCRFPPDSNHAFFVHDALVEWAKTKKLLKPGVEPSDDQIRFLKVFDLMYAERRVRFVINRLNGLFNDADPDERDRLNKTKELLYGEIVKLKQATADAGSGPRGDAVKAVFDKDRVRTLIDSPDQPDKVIAEFVKGASKDIDGLREGFERFLNDRLGDFGKKGYKVLLEATEGWDPATREDLLARYVGYPLWDVLIFPISAVSDVGELNRVEVVRFSPADASILKAPDQPDDEPPSAERKLKGVTLGHFAAFFGRGRRENDYLWGRLDTAERLIGLVLGEPAKDLCHDAFGAIISQEERKLKKSTQLLKKLREQVPAG